MALAFAISSSGHHPPEFSCPCTCEADAALLQGDAPPEQSDADTLVVRRRAASAGVATVVLHVRGNLEFECSYADPAAGCGRYTSHQPAEVSSAPFDLTLADAPTATPTPTPRATPGRSGGDGCQLDAHPSAGGIAGLAFLSAALLLARRLRARGGGSRAVRR